nr:MAG: ORF1 [Torque teno midi virus]
MPFWWRRRRRPWFGRWFQRRKPRYQRRRKRKRRYKRRYRRTTGRRYRRRGKVRRKRKTLLIKQWQPDSIALCKIKLFGSIVLGAEGCQYLCYTNQKIAWTPPQQPGGGGFGIETYNLSYLYDQYKLKRCIWTRTNLYKDLCRYLRCKFIFYRHEYVDFVLSYSRQPPWLLAKDTYMNCHPIALLLSRHKKVILSRKNHPQGKNKIVINVRPPKQMISKWFFQKQFALYDLLEIRAAACDIGHPKMSYKAENQIITIYYINPEFYQDSLWAQYHEGPYRPVATMSDNLVFHYKYSGKTGQYQLQIPSTKTGQEKYYYSVSRDKGYFCPQVINAYKITISGTETHTYSLPLRAARYNPEIDDGNGNFIYLVAVNKGHYDKPNEDNLVFAGLPLWLMFFGLYSFITKIKTISFMPLHMFVVKSPYLLPKPTNPNRQFFPIIDYNFLLGKNPSDSYVSETESQQWYPTCEHQVETINNFVKAGPFIPRLENDRASTWELPYKSIFYFKWGGPQMPDEQVADPKEQESYLVPDTVHQRVQISDPLKQATESLIHEWDYRRGLITKKAYKRMLENLSTESDVYSHSGTPTKRKRMDNSLQFPQEENKEVKTCLQALCETSSSEKEEETSDLKQLIKYQKLKQKQLKLNLLKLIKNIKETQNQLQLQTGMI